ncbi:MAG TPA: ATP synthase F1 subunit delta [Clostridiales bacterium]|nr:ATP synthase F1 subunit delta [Clostridiales bacterium]
MSRVADYGYALYELALEENIEERIEEEFANVVNILNKNIEFIKLLSNPRIPTVERISLLDKIFKGNIHFYLLSLLKILVEKRMISSIVLIYKEFKNKYYDDKNILLVTAISAIELNNSQQQKIIDKLAKSMKKTVVLNNKVDKSCIGGVRLEYQGRMVDASVKNRFKKLQLNLKNADYSVAEV